MKKARIRLLLVTVFSALVFSTTAVTARADEIVPDRYEVAFYAGESDFSVYMDTERNLYTAGGNDSGQLGRGTADTDTKIQPVKVLENVKTARTGRTGFVIALTYTGDVYTWGNNKYGQLGTGTGFAEDNAYIAQPTRIVVPGTVVDVAAGARSAYAVTEDGKVYAWGSNFMGGLGLGTETGRRAVVGTPTAIDQASFGGAKVRQVACTEYSAYAVTEDGKVYAWGDNDNGQLGIGNDDTSYFTATPAQAAIDGVRKLSARSNTVMALVGDQAYIWGVNNFGQLGLGHEDAPEYVSAPTLIDTYFSPEGEEETVAAADIVCGGITNFVISASGNVYSFGSGGDGKVGYSLDSLGESASVDVSNVTRPTRVTFYKPRSIYDITENNIEEWKGASPIDLTSPIEVRITAGVGSSGDRTFCVDESGKVWSWGNNKNGLAASGDISNCLAPVRATLYRNDNYDKTVKTKNYMIKPAVSLLVIFGLGAAGLIYLEIKHKSAVKLAKRNVGKV